MDAYVPPALGRYSRAISGATTAYAYDAGITFFCNGTFTLTLDLPPNMGANWTCSVMNIGTGVITIDAQSRFIVSAKGLSDHTDTLGSGDGHILGCNGTDFSVLSTNYNETGNATWGAITGTLALQTDLQSALDAKVDETITVTGTGMLTGGGALTANQAITLASTAASTILGNNTGAPAVPIAMTVAQTKALLAYTPADIGAQAKSLTVTNRTTDLTLDASLASVAYQNNGATALTTFTLPANTIGVRYYFIVDDADGIKILCPASTTIAVGTTISSSAGYTTSTAIGSTISILCYAANKWVATSITGTWTTA